MSQWLRNRTDTELEELFENIRSENFRRMMCMSAISTQLPQVFTSSNVLRALELLQTDDLERLASLPLFEDRYQRLSNATFLELLQKVYDFGLTQVMQHYVPLFSLWPRLRCECIASGLGSTKQPGI